MLFLNDKLTTNIYVQISLQKRGNIFKELVHKAVITNLSPSPLQGTGYLKKRGGGLYHFSNQTVNGRYVGIKPQY